MADRMSILLMTEDKKGKKYSGLELEILCQAGLRVPNLGQLRSGLFSLLAVAHRGFTGRGSSRLLLRGPGRSRVLGV